MVSDPVAAVKWRAIEVVWGRLGRRQNPRWTVSSDTYKFRGLELLNPMPMRCFGTLVSPYDAVLKSTLPSNRANGIEMAAKQSNSMCSFIRI